jgi:hypothetical protein
MKTVWKYPIGFAGDLTMPEGARPLHVAVQRDTIQMWALVDTERPTVRRTFLACGTGHDIPANSVYIGTALMGQFVWHVFELVSP